MTFTYRVLVRNTGDTGYHQRIVQNTVTLPEVAQPGRRSAESTAWAAPESLSLICCCLSTCVGIV